MSKKNTSEIETLEQALEVIDGLKKELDQAKADNAEQAAIIAEIRKTGGAKSAQKPRFEHEGKTYQVNAGKFNYNNQIFTAQDLCENPKLQAELLEAKVGFIEEVKD